MPPRIARFSFILCLLAAVLLHADDFETLLKRFVKKPTGALAGELLTQSMEQRRVADARQALLNAIAESLGKKENPRLPASRLKELVCMSDTCFMLMFIEDAPPDVQNSIAGDDAFLKWFFATESRRNLFMDSITIGEDNTGKALEIIHTLYRHDSAGRAKCWPLMLAMALVWDTERPPLHDQTGEQMLPFEPDIEKRYDYFKDVMTSPGAPFPLAKLSVPVICFVVDTPVPISELEWAQKNVRERNPEKIYSGIKYDFKRLRQATGTNSYGDDAKDQKAAISWHNGPYSLANIQKTGGICSDQAYFTTMVLRARGIPAMIFCGVGTSGGHAWVAYLKGKNAWDTEVGRYKDKKFVTGISRNPMTNGFFDDHRLPLLCAKITPAKERTKDSDPLVRLSKLLAGMRMPKAAQQAAELAVKAESTNLDAWLALLNAQTDVKKCNPIFDRLATAFKDYPDIVTSMRLQQADVLRQKGKRKQADELLENMPDQQKDRTDLSRKVSLAQVDAAIKNNDAKKARILYEDYLKEQKADGTRILEDALRYLAFTKETKQTAEAAAFIPAFVKTARRSMEKILKKSADKTYENWDIKLLIMAYENNNDFAKARKLRKKLD